ncbi:MAG: YeiH family protein [Oscillospiraceae bacterium]
MANSKKQEAQASAVSDEIVSTEKFSIRDLICKEDWLTIWAAFIVMLLSAVSVLTGWFPFTSKTFGTWGDESHTLASALSGSTLLGILFTFVLLLVLFCVCMKLMHKDVKKFAIAFTGFFLITCVVRFISSQVVLNQYLEYAFWALLVGLLISNTVGVPDWLKPAMNTEFYIKTGLVLMGATVMFSNISKFGLYGLGIAWLVTPTVIIFMWLFGTKILKIKNKPMVITIAAATSVCGTSAAIATAAAAKAKKTDLTFAVGMSLIFTVVMMVGMPFFCRFAINHNFLGMTELIGGSWIGGTVDSTGAVVLAGEALGDVAGQAAALVKMIQNILIGFIAFAVAIFFATKVDRTGDRAVGAGEIWTRMPKFILGFLGASLIFSFIIEPVFGSETCSAIQSCFKQTQTWCFAMAFTSIGLETNFKEMKAQFSGGKPLALYIVGQLFNLVLTYFVCWLLLSGVLFGIPVISA